MPVHMQQQGQPMQGYHVVHQPVGTPQHGPPHVQSHFAVRLPAFVACDSARVLRARKQRHGVLLLAATVRRARVRECVRTAKRTATHTQSPAPGSSHYMMSPGQYVSPMHGVAASPVVDCWGLPAWFPFGSAPQPQPVVMRAPPPHPALVAYDHIIKVLAVYAAMSVCT
jgi:hypothetical protein